MKFDVIPHIIVCVDVSHAWCHAWHRCCGCDPWGHASVVS